MTRARRWFGMIVLLLLSACSVFPSSQPTAALATPTPALSPEVSPTVSPQVTPSTDPSSLAAATETMLEITPLVPDALTLWLPPAFDPNSGSRSGMILKARLEAFEQQFGARVQVRLKDPAGPGSLMESLQAAGEAAPMALPSVIALPRADLEVAAIKGLVMPLDGLSTAIDEADWYDYSRQLAMVQGATFALPFAGDALVVVYRPAKVIGPPVDWDAVFRLGQPFAFPAADAQSLLTLTLYQSVDGQIEDAQRRPTLQVDALVKVLQLYADGEERGIFPIWLSQYETYDQVWQAYQEQRVNAVVAWSSSYLSTLPSDSAVVPLPSLGENALTVAAGWGWAVTDPDPQRQVLAARLAEFLSAGDFLAGWSEAAGYIPTRPSALAGWTTPTLKTLVSPIVVAAQARPSNDLLASHGIVLKDATLGVLKQDSKPQEAAQIAADRLSPPQSH